MDNIDELFKKYDAVRSAIVEEENNLFKRLNNSLGEGKIDWESPLAEELRMNINLAYPFTLEYINYKRLLEAGETLSFFNISDVNLLVMDKAMSLKPEDINSKDYLDITHSAYNEVGLEKIEMLLSVDELNVKIYSNNYKESTQNIKHKILIYSKFYDSIVNHQLT